MTSDNDKKAAVEYADDIWNGWLDREHKNYREAFLAGCEHKQKELEQIKEQVARDAWFAGAMLDKKEITFQDYWQQENKGEG